MNTVTQPPALPCWHGDLAKYTGRTEEAYGQTWREIELVEGHLKGQTRLIPAKPKESKPCP